MEKQMDNEMGTAIEDGVSSKPEDEGFYSFGLCGSSLKKMVCRGDPGDI